MPNGVPQLYAAGRAANTVYSSRAIPTLFGGLPSPNFYSAFSPAAWGRSGGMCAPVQQCCCLGPINVAPGETAPILINMAAWVNSTQYSVFGVEGISLFDMGLAPPAPADPDIIKVTSGIAGADPDPIDNSDIPANLLPLYPPNAIGALVEASPDAPLGRQYKLTVCVIGCNGCEGRKIRRCECVVLTIAEC